jgi:hypothetical protein
LRARIFIFDCAFSNLKFEFRFGISVYIKNLKTKIKKKEKGYLHAWATIRWAQNPFHASPTLAPALSVAVMVGPGLS